MSEQWAGDRVTRWLAQADELERQLAPVSTVLLAAAALHEGERVLDVGCGTGPTTLDAARAVGASGAVTGLDIAPEMLEAAAAREGLPVEWVCADVASWARPAAAYDVVLSRFGVMFFADPGAAMHRLAEVTRPGGRLVLAVWGPRSASPLFEAPYQAARAALAAHGHAVPPETAADEGPYSWSSSSYVAPLLTGAGWRDVDIATHELVLPVAGGEPAAAARSALDFGPTRALLADRGEDERGIAEDAVREVFAGALDDDGRAQLPASVRLVTAHR